MMANPKLVSGKILFVVMCLCALGLKAQDSFFSPLNTQNLRTSVSSDGLVSIVHGPGQVDFRMPLGPGLHSRGLSFVPLARLRPGQRLIPQDGGTGGPVWGSSVSKDIDDLSSMDIAADGPNYMDQFAPHLVGGGTPSSLYNAYCLSWTSSDTYGNRVTPLVQWAAPPPASQTHDIWSEVGFSPDMGLSRGLSPGGGIVNLSPYSSSMMGEGAFTLPDGGVIRVLSVLGWTGYDMGTTPSQLSEFIINPAQFGDLLSQFRFNASDLDGTTCLRATGRSLAFFMHDSSGHDAVSKDDFSSTSLPSRVVVVRDNIAYVFQFLGVRDEHEQAAVFGPDGEYVTPSGEVFDSVCYNLVSIRNRFGDSVDFVYGSNQFDYTATLSVNGVSTGQQVEMTLDSVTAATDTTPDLNQTQAQAVGTYGPYLHYGLIKDAIIHLRYVSSAGVVSSYRIAGKIDDPTIFMDFYGPGDSHEGPGLRYYRDYIQFMSITDELSGYSTSFDWQWSTFHSNWAGGQDLGIATLADIKCGNGEQISFSYQGDNCVDWSFLSLWEGFYWGVSSVTRTDTASGTSRVTTYARNTPHATNWSPGGASLSGVPLTWMNTDCWEAETSPDGCTVVRRYYPAVGTPDPGQRGSWVFQLTNFVQDRLYKSALPFEERHYPPGADWRADMTNESASTTADRIRFSDGWDTRSHFPVTSNSFSVLTLQVFKGGGVYEADEFYPTRTIDWDKERGVAQVELAYNWDPYSSQWPDLHQVVVQTSDPWTDLGYHYDRFSDASIGVSTYGSAVTFPAGAIDRLDQTAYRSLDGWFVVGDWTNRSFTQNGLQRLPGINRASIASNGVTQSETVVGSDAWVKRQYTYPTDSTGVPGSMAVHGSSGLLQDGLIGYSYGYDPTYNLNSITSLSPALTTQRTFDMLGNVISVKDPNGYTDQYSWDTLGRITAITPPGSETPTSFSYGSDFRSATLSRGSGEQGRFYNAFGDLIRETRVNPDGSWNHRNTGYDSVGRRTWQTTWQSGPGTDMGWDSPNPPTLPSGNGYVPATRWSYDYRDRLIQVVTPAGEVQTIAYNGLTRTVIEDPNGAQPAATVFQSDLLGRLSSVTDALNQTTSYTYDTADRLIGVVQKDPISGATQTRSWSYNSLGWLTSLTQPESGTTTFSGFTVVGKPTVTVYGYGSASPRTLRTTLDGLERPLTVTADDGSVDQAFVYDGTQAAGGRSANSFGSALGKVVYARDKAVEQWMYYRPLLGGLSGRLEELDTQVWPSGVMGSGTPYTFAQRYGYNDLGMRVQGQVDGRAWNLGVDPVRALPSSLTYGTQSAVQVQYDPSSWAVTQLTYGNGFMSQFGYDTDQARLASMKHFPVSGAALASWTFGYDPKGNLTAVTDVNAGKSDTYTYDPLHRLSEAWTWVGVSGSAAVGQGIRQNFTYDAFGNRTSSQSQLVTNWTVMAAPQSATYGVMPSSLPMQNVGFSALSVMSTTNHLPSQTSTGAMTGAAYDLQGNLTQVFQKVGDASTSLNMAYDTLGRVMSLSDAGRGVNEKYFYDSSGLRTMIQTWQGTTLLKTRIDLYNDQRQLVSEYQK